MWFYLPKSRAQVHRTQKAFCNDTPYKQNRRQRYAVFPKLREAFFFCLFMIIALRIGSITFLMLFDLGALKASLFLAGHTNKPNVPEITHFSQYNSSRMMVYISIDRSGNILLEGESYLAEDLSKALYYNLISEPRAIATLIIDKDCEMEHVHNVYAAIRESGIRHVTHVVNPSTSVLNKR